MGLGASRQSPWVYGVPFVNRIWAGYYGSEVAATSSLTTAFQVGRSHSRAVSGCDRGTPRRWATGTRDSRLPISRGCTPFRRYRRPTRFVLNTTLRSRRLSTDRGA